MLLANYVPPKDPKPFEFSDIGKGFQGFQEILDLLYIHIHIVEMSYLVRLKFMCTHMHVSRLMVVSCEAKEEVTNGTLMDLRLIHVGILQEQMP